MQTLCYVFISLSISFSLSLLSFYHSFFPPLPLPIASSLPPPFFLFSPPPSLLQITCGTQGDKKLLTWLAALKVSTLLCTRSALTSRAIIGGLMKLDSMLKHEGGGRLDWAASAVKTQTREGWTRPSARSTVSSEHQQTSIERWYRTQRCTYGTEFSFEFTRRQIKPTVHIHIIYT